MRRHAPLVLQARMQIVVQPSVCHARLDTIRAIHLPLAPCALLVNTLPTRRLLASRALRASTLAMLP